MREKTPKLNYPMDFIFAKMMNYRFCFFFLFCIFLLVVSLSFFLFLGVLNLLSKNGKNHALGTSILMFSSFEIQFFVGGVRRPLFSCSHHLLCLSWQRHQPDGKNKRLDCNLFLMKLAVLITILLKTMIHVAPVPPVQNLTVGVQAMFTRTNIQ